MALCDLTQFGADNIYQSLVALVNKKLNNIDTDPQGVFDVENIIKDIYSLVYNNKGKDMKKAMGIAQHVPSALITVTSNNTELTGRIISKAKDKAVMTKLYDLNMKFSQNIENVREIVAPDMGLKKSVVKALTTNTLEPSEPGTVDNSNDNLEYILRSLDIKEPVDFFSTFFREVKVDENGKYTSEIEPQYAFIYNTFRNILKEFNKNKLNNATTLTYDNHTGFRLKLFSTEDPFIRERRVVSKRDQAYNAPYLLALTDNTGNLLMFNEEGRIDMTSGKMVYFYLRTKSTPSFIEEAKKLRRQQLEKIYKNDQEKIDTELESFVKSVREMRDKSVEDVRQMTQDFNMGKNVLLDITGGKKGVYDKTPFNFSDIFPTLTEEEIDSIAIIKTPGLNRGYASIKLEGVDERVHMIPSRPLNASNELLLNIAQVMTYKGEDITNDDKIKYFTTFIFPKSRDINDKTPGIYLGLDADTNDIVLLVRNENIDLGTITPEELADKLKGSYIRIDSQLLKDKLYDKYTIIGDRAIVEPNQDYIDLIKDTLRIYATPNRRMVDGKQVIDRIAEVNGYFTWRPATEYFDEAIKTTQQNDKKNLSDIDDDSWNISYDMNKIIREFGTPEQQAKVKEWWEKSPLSKAKDANGKPLIPLQVLFNVVNSNAWARWSLSGIELFAGSDFTHLYHESWHAFSQLYLSKAEKKALYKETSELPGSFKIPDRIINSDGTVSFDYREVKFKDATDQELEEYIAEEFRKYAIAKGDMEIKQSVRKNIFQRIWDFLKKLFTGYTPAQVANQPETVKPLKEIFETLYVGNIYDYNPGIDNIIFDTANAGALHVDDQSVAEDPNKKYLLENLNIIDTKLLISSMDGFISKYISIKAFNKDSTLKGGGFVKVFKDKSAMSEIYYKMLQQFVSRRDFLVKQKNRTKDLQEAATLDRYIKILDWAEYNYGQLNNSLDGIQKTGLITYHMEHSVFKDHIKDYEKDEIDDDDIEAALKKSSRNTIDRNNFVNLEEEADIMTLWLIESLVEQEVAEDGTYKDAINELGFPKLANSKESMRTLIKNICGEKRLIPMYNDLVKLAGRYPIFNQLVQKLGNPAETMDDQQFSLWAKFIQDFNKHTVKIYRLLLEAGADVSDETVDIKTWEVKVGHAAADDVKVFRDWRASFITRTPSEADPYVKESYVKDAKTITLDAKAISDEFLTESIGGYVLKNKDREFEFLNALGIKLSDNVTMRQALDDLNVAETISYIATVIGNAGKKNAPIADPFEFLKSNGNLSTRLKTLAKLEANFSEKYNTLMRIAPGNRKIYEQNLNSSATQKVYAINESKDFKDLLTNEEFRHMRFLSPYGRKSLGFISSNPMTEQSILMNTIYNLETPDLAKYGKKLKKNGRDINIDIISLVGAEVVDIGEYFGDGVSHVNMSRPDKFLTDFYSVTRSGIFEQQRHGSKSSYFGTKTSKIRTYAGKSNDSLYADHILFKSSENSNEYVGFYKMYPFLLKYLTGETLRIAEYEKNKNIYDTWKGFDEAGNFTIFDKILSEPVKTILKSEQFRKELLTSTANRSYTPIQQILLKPEYKTLDIQIRKDMKFYFDSYIERLNDNTFRLYKDRIVDSAYDELNKSTDEVLTKAQQEQAMLRSFAYNTWFHYVEQTIFHYGDPFFYKHNSEDMAKRIATMFATGQTFLYDKVTMNWVNNSVGRPYYDRLVKEGKITPNQYAKTKTFDGTLATSVIQDTKPKSIYINILEETFRKGLESEGKTPEQIDEMLYGKDGTSKSPVGGYMEPWEKMTEADGSGMITIDAYRILKKIQGKWSEDVQEKLYQRIINNEPVGVSEVLEIFPEYKLLMSGQLAVEKDLLPITSLHKFALVPLIPNVFKNTNLDKLHNKMMEQGIDYVLVESSSKLAYITNNKDKKADLASLDNNTNFFNENVQFTINPIYIAYLKDQLDLGNTFKEYSTFSSQLKRLLTYGIYEDGKPVDYSGTYASWKKLTYNQKLKASPLHGYAENFRNRLDKLINYEQAKLLESIGGKYVNGKYVGSEKALIDFIKEEMKKEGFSEHEVNYITYDNNMNMEYTTVSLDTSFDSQRIERMLLAIVNNYIVRQKIKGEPFVEQSGAYANDNRDTFFTPSKEDYEKYKFSHAQSLENYEEYLKVLQNQYGTSGLPFYRPILGAAMKAIKVKVALRGDYVHMFNLTHIDGNKIAVYDEKLEVVDGVEMKQRVLNEDKSLARLNQCIKDEKWLDIGDHRSMITITGVRIPVQYLNSMEYAEIFEFLPSTAGPIIILPAEIVVKTGTDFDVDKLTSYIAHITRSGKYLKDEFDSPAEIMDRIDEVLDRRDELIQELTGKDIDDKKLIKAIREDIKEKRELDYQKYQAALVRKDALRARFDVIIKDKVLKDLNLEKNKNNITRRLFKAIYKIDNTVDIYNVLTDFKQLENKSNYKLLSKAGKAELAKAGKIYSEYIELVNAISEGSKAYKVNLEQTEITISEIKKLTDEYNDLYYQYNRFRSGIENSLMTDIRTILELPMNSYRMLKPNSAHILKPLAEKLEKYVEDVKFRDAETKKLSPTTTVAEYDYQLKRHQDGIIAGASLGISANSNTFNVQNNEGGNYIPPYTPVIGMYDANSNPVYYSVPSVLYFKHNKTKRTIDGKSTNVISLGKILDADKMVEIGEVFNQFISGFVDAEKENWPAYIQGNRETVPTTLNVSEAGVDIETVIYFVSNPLIRKYVKLIQEKKGVFSRFTGSGTKQKFYKSEAAKEILNSIDYDALGLKTKYYLKSGDFREQSIIDNKVARYHMMVELKNKLYGKKNISKKDALAAVTTPEGNKSIEQKQKDVLMLLHFMFIENMYQGNDQLKQIAKPDRQRITSLFDAQIRKNSLERLKNSGSVAPEQITYLQTESSIKGAFIEDFALDVFGPLFKLTNNPTFNGFLGQQISSFKNMQYIEQLTNMDDEMYAKRFRSDFPLFLLTNYVKQLVPGKSGYYKGLRVKEEVPKVEYAEGFGPTSVYVKPYNGVDTIFINLAQIRDEYTNKAYTPGNKRLGSVYKVNNLAAVEDGFFANERDYYNFVVEREYLRYLTPIDTLLNDKEFLDNVKNIKSLTKKPEGVDQKVYDTNVKLLAYEVLLRDRALDNTLNFVKMFESGLETYSARLDKLLEEYDYLPKQYPVLDKFISRKKTDKRGLVAGSKTLYLTLQDIANLDGDEIEEYHNQLVKLSDETELKVKGNTEKAKSDNKYISDFFKKISIYAFMEAGFSTGEYSFTRIVPTAPYKTIMDAVVKDLGPVTPGMLSIYNTKLLQRYSVMRIKEAKLPFDYTTDLDTDIIAQEEYKYNLYLKTKEKVSARKGAVTAKTIGVSDRLKLETQIIRDFIRPTATENIYTLLESVQIRKPDGTVLTDRNGEPIYASLYDIPYGEKEMAKAAKERGEFYKERNNLQILLDSLGPDFYAVVDDSMTRATQADPIAKRKELKVLKFGNLLNVPKRENIKVTIVQARTSGIEYKGSKVEAKDSIKKLLKSYNPRSFDMVAAGVRTRTTRSAEEMRKYAEALGRPLAIGDFFINKDPDTGEEIIARVTGLYKKGQRGYKETWDQEGWRDEDITSIDKFAKGATAITFTTVPQILGIRTTKFTKEGKLEPLNVSANFELAKEKLEDDIKTIKDLYAKGKKLLFVTSGYGQNYVSKKVDDTKYQLVSEEEKIVSEKTVRDLAARMSDRIGIPFQIISDRTEKFKGKIENNRATINLAYATLDTPIHEILGHPIIRAIRNRKSEDGSIEEYNNFMSDYWDKHPEKSREEVEKYVEKNFKPTIISSQLYQNLLKELEYGKGKEVLDRIKRDYDRKDKIEQEETPFDFTIDKVLKKQGEFYTLEEQQEEAIVELLGLYTADRLDKVKDAKLIEIFKQLLKQIKKFIKDLLLQKEVEIAKLPDDMTIGDLADLLAYSNSKLILPGYEVQYTTPDNSKFKTYGEASRHITELAKNVTDVDLSNVNIKKEIKENDYFEVDDDFGFTDPFAKTKALKVNKNPIIDFIEKNKEYEQSKEIIEEWKKINNIKYNPEEVYSRGQEFTSVVGAYSDFDVNLMMQNLLQHIEDNEKAGGEFTISAFTKPTDRIIGHLERGGGKIKFKIYPKSEDIKWAANQDVYSGSVWDASKKISKDKKSELLGVSYTKYPTLGNLKAVQPNLASIIDNLAHHHNELGISLTGNNFRLEYDNNIPYSTKKIIDSVNSILDQKYGKLVKPKINKDKKQTILIDNPLPENERNGVISYSSDYGGGYFLDTIYGYEKRGYALGDKISYLKVQKILRIVYPNSNVTIQPITNIVLVDGKDIVTYKGLKFETPDKIEKEVLGIQPTQTNETLKKSIDSIKDKKIQEFEYTLKPITKEQYDKAVEKSYEFTEDGETYFVDVNNTTRYKRNSKGYFEEIATPKEKKYTSQALINTKIAKLKEVAKKYPRSLIRSEVKPITVGSEYMQFAEDELPFQKIPSQEPGIKLTPAPANTDIKPNKRINDTKLFLIDRVSREPYKVGDEVDVLFYDNDNTSIMTITKIEPLSNGDFRVKISPKPGKEYTYVVNSVGDSNKVLIGADEQFKSFGKLSKEEMAQYAKDLKSLKQVPFKLPGKFTTPIISGKEKYTINRTVGKEDEATGKVIETKELVNTEGYKISFIEHPNAVFYLTITKDKNDNKLWQIEELNTGLTLHQTSIYDTPEDVLRKTMDNLEGLENLSRDDKKYDSRMDIINKVGLDPNMLLKGKQTEPMFVSKQETAPVQEATPTSTPTPMTEQEKSDIKGEFFVYLSKRLAEEFNYKNPNSDNQPTIENILATRRPVTQQEIEEAKRNCKGKLS